MRRYAAAHNITRATPDEIYAQCDIISLHLPLTPETENFIGAAELAKMKPDAILVNTARGGLIDENALLDVLEAGKIYGAGIDAFSSEPPKDPRWFTLDNVVLGSHCAASTSGASRNMGRDGHRQPDPRPGTVRREERYEVHSGPRPGHLRQQGHPVQRRGTDDHQRGVQLRLPLLQRQLGRAGPGGLWQAICVTSKNLIDKAGIDPGEIAAISFSGQMMGCLCVDKQGNPLRPSIIWADQRAQKQAAALGEHIALRDFYHIAGHRNSASYGLQKLMWGAGQ